MDRSLESVDEVLDFAIANEVEANRSYLDLAAKMDVPAMTEVFEEFAREEQGHKAKLETVKRGQYSFGTGAAKVQDLALAGEEAKHKLRFEIEYDDVVLKESWAGGRRLQAGGCRPEAVPNA